MAIKKIVLFHIDKQVYGIDIYAVKAIELNSDAVKVPNAPENIEGIINLRGDVIPVYSLHSKFHLHYGEQTKDSRLIIVGEKDHMFAFRVDAVEEIVEVEEEALMAPPQVLTSKQTSYIDSVVNVNGKLVLCLDVDRVLSENEMDNLKNFVDGLQEE